MFGAFGASPGPLMSSEGEARKQRQQAQQRVSIIDAAARAFVRAGYEATTMRAIAAEAGFRAPSLYTYFASKEEIFAALVARVHDVVISAFEAPVPSSLSFEQRLELLLMRQMQLVQTHRDAIVFLVSHSMGGAATPPPGDADGLMLYIARIIEWFEVNSTPADVGGLSPRDAAYFLWGVEHALFVQWVHGGGTSPLTDQVPLMQRLFTKGVS